MRAGRYIQQSTDYRAFLPAPLPPDPPVAMDGALTRLLSDADRALGRLDGVASVLPDPDLFVAMYVRQEAVLSSQIEGTQSTLEDVLEFEANSSFDDATDVRFLSAANHHHQIFTDDGDPCIDPSFARRIFDPIAGSVHNDLRVLYHRRCTPTRGSFAWSLNEEQPRLSR